MCWWNLMRYRLCTNALNDTALSIVLQSVQTRQFKSIGRSLCIQRWDVHSLQFTASILIICEQNRRSTMGVVCIRTRRGTVEQRTRKKQTTACLHLFIITFIKFLKTFPRAPRPNNTTTYENIPAARAARSQIQALFLFFQQRFMIHIMTYYYVFFY